EGWGAREGCGRKAESCRGPPPQPTRGPEATSATARASTVARAEKFPGSVGIRRATARIMRNHGLAWGRTLTPRDAGESAVHSSRATEHCLRRSETRGGDHGK